MKTIIAALLLSIILFAACQKDDATTADGNTITLAADVAGTTTRAGSTGIIDNATLADADYGFGVFAYSGSTALFSNTRVTYKDGMSGSAPGDVHLHPSNWTYGSVLDWPENTAYSFFAYAPYVASPAAGTGITAVTGNSNGPTIGYTVAPNPSESVDLLWGVRADANPQNGNAKGLPWLNQTRDSNGGLVLFTFHHALAALGFHVQAMIDKDNDLADLTDASSKLGTDCKITLKSITLTPAANSFYESATLSLNNATPNTPQWSSPSGAISSLTLADHIAATLKDPTPADIGAFMANTAIPGITETANSQLVIAQNSSKEQLFMLIPQAAQTYNVTVEYYVTYKTSNTPTYARLDYTGAKAGTATISGMELKADTKYYINLVIGLKTFSLNVTATDWNDTPVDLGVMVEQGTSANSSLSRQNSCQP